MKNINPNQRIPEDTGLFRRWLTELIRDIAEVVNGVDHGTYTPTPTNNANIDSSTAYECLWLKVGANVTVSGSVDVNPAAASTLTILYLSLPAPSNFQNTRDASGTAVRGGTTTTGLAGVILGNTSADTVQLTFINDADTAERTWRFHFTYRILP